MLDAVLSRGRRRMVGDRLLSNLALAVAVFLAGLALLAVLGTRILDWWAPASLFAVCLAIGAVRVWRSAPSTETVARVLDRRCSLADLLATAVHFRQSESGVAVAQRHQAESAAGRIDLPQALPYRVPKSLFAGAALAVAVSALLFYRFGIQRELTLAAPIAHLNLDPLGLATRAEERARRERAAAGKSANATAPEGIVNRLGTSTSDNPGEKDSTGPQGSAVTTGPQQGKPDAGAATEDGKKAGGAREESSDASEAGAAAPKAGGDQPPSSRDGAQQGAQSGSKSPGSPNSSGLMSKLRDAVSSLMSKMKPEGNQAPPGGTQAAQQPNGKQPSGQQAGSQAGKPDAKGNPSDQDGQESASSDSDQMAPGKGAGKSSDQKASAKPGSGMGHQDGSKELKDAEQLSAMGKLSEIIGKRSANVTGEMTIEPQDGPQQLKTGYTHSTARHGEAAGDVNRDEVPLALQSYVKQYFDQVRKPAAAKAKPAAN